jgi:hypothetical protein
MSMGVLVDLHHVQRALNDERARGDPWVGAAGRGQAAAMDIELTDALEPTIDCRARRAGDLLQPAQGADFLDQINHAQRPSLLAHDLDGFFDGFLLLGRQARGQRLPARLWPAIAEVSSMACSRAR